jgi:hypothetical protein
MTQTRGDALSVPALATAWDILSRVVEVVRGLGVTGEDRLVQLLYLAVTSRLLDKRPVCIAVKGPSSAGKSFATGSVLRLFPPSAYVELSAMSERALVYWTEPLAHRMLVIYEESGIQGEMGSYLIRSLISEGRVKYATVDRAGGALEGRKIEREGPTGLILTTTKHAIHPENETRLLSVPANDTAAQTRSVLLAIAGEDEASVDLTDWHELQEWLAAGDGRTTVPFRMALAEAIPALGIRLRRDFGLLLQLIRSHALLHRGVRERDASGRIVATLDDYEAIRVLVSDLIAEGLEASLPPTVRETVDAVAALLKTGRSSVSLSELATHLGLDKSTVSRRAAHAVQLGHLHNREERRGMPACLILGDPLPRDAEVLPSREALETAAGRCGVAADSGGRGAENSRDSDRSAESR